MMLRFAQTDFEANKKMPTAFSSKGVEVNLYLAFLWEIFAIFHRKHLPIFRYFQKIFVKRICLERKRKNVIFSFSSLKKYLSYDDDSDEDEDEGFDISM